jgi:hypothetical protein
MDFGQAFYCTSNEAQARRFARVVLRREYGKGRATVSCYKFDVGQLDALEVLEFRSAGNEWFEYVTSNRRGVDLHPQFDLIIGPVADDRVLPTILLYEDGFLTREQALEQFKTWVYADQYAFRSAAALDLLSFVSGEEVRGTA